MKQGNVKFCPNCGEPWVSGAIRCSACGHYATDIEANNSAKNLDERLRKASTIEEKVEIIRSFPIPTAREDIIEFLSSLEPKTYSKIHGKNEVDKNNQQKIREAYREKFNECLNKALILYPNDNSISLLVKKNKKNKNTRRILITFGSLCLLSVIVSLVFYTINYTRTHSLEYYLNNGQYEEAILKFNPSSKRDKEKYEFFSNIIISLCNKKKIEEAYSYVKLAKGYFKVDMIGLNDYSTFRVEKRLNEIINSYEIELGYKSKELTWEELRDSGEYEKALEVFEKVSNSDESKFNFVKSCIVRMCQNGEKQRALKFLKSCIGNFPENEKFHTYHYNRDYVKKTLSELINSY